MTGIDLSGVPETPKGIHLLQKPVDMGELIELISS
jgi:hypothetical protein